jgi:hypothetical protein
LRREQLESNHRENRATGKEGKTAHRYCKHSPQEKKKWRYTCRLFRTNSLKEGAVWHIDPLLGNNCKTNNETAAIARQQLLKYSTVLEPLLGTGLHATVEVLLEAVFSIGPLQGCITQLTELR